MQTNGNGKNPEFLTFDWFKRALGGAPEVPDTKPPEGAYSDPDPDPYPSPSPVPDPGIEKVRLVQQHVLTALALKNLRVLKGILGDDFTGAGRQIEGMIQEVQLLRNAIATKYGAALLDRIYEGHDPLQGL